MTPTAHLIRFGLPALSLFAGVPASLLRALRAGLERDDISGVIGCCIWAMRLRYRIGCTRTTANPVAYCDTEETARYIHDRLLARPVTNADKNLVHVAHTLWRELGQGGKLAVVIPFLTRQHLRKSMEAFVTERTARFAALKASLPVSDLLRIERHSAASADAISDIKTLLQADLETASGSATRRLDMVQSQDKIDALVDAVRQLEQIEPRVFVCGDTLRRALTSGVLFDGDLTADLGHFLPISVETLADVLPNWQIDTEATQTGMCALTSPDGLTVRLWHHTEESGAFVRQTRYLKWSYGSDDLQDLRLHNHTFKRLCTSSVAEEYGRLTEIDHILERTVFEAGNLSFKPDEAGAPIWLAEMLADAISTRTRLEATLLIDLFHVAYGLDYRLYLPVSDTPPAAVCTYVYAPPSAEHRDDIKTADRLITDRIAGHFQSFTAKATRLDAEAAKTALIDTKHLLDAAGVPFFLLGGTLLGAVRGGDFIAADYDIDIGVFDRDTDDQQVQKIFSGSEDFDIKEIVASHLVKAIHRNGVEVDLFIHDRIEGGERHKGRVHEWYNHPFDLVEFDFLGGRYHVPADYHLWLDENYGHWEKPVLFYNVSFDTPNRKYVTDTVDGLYHLATQIRKALTAGNRGDFLMASKALRTEFGLDIFDLPVLADKLGSGPT